MVVPLEVWRELTRNLSDRELVEVREIVDSARQIEWNYIVASPRQVKQFEQRGAKKGDAVISAELEVAGVKWLISENRHFLAEINDLPFKVISAEEALELIASS